MIGGWRRRQAPSAGETLPLLPLDNVLFPGSTLNLRQLEPGLETHLAALAASQSPLVVSLLAETPGAVHALGTRATIRHTAGVFALTGIARVRLLEIALATGPVRSVAVAAMPAVPQQAVPAAQRALLLLLAQAPVADPVAAVVACAEDAEAAGYRLIDLLPVPARARQKLLELDDPLERLTIVQRYLAQRGLMP